ncbi:hypothetical protein B0H13DRAFT_1871050 [Mycena leptocephala]|nr:hypothetical protein B0H13DRAFT_1871050 [Mycena leptocephala]
MFRTYLHPLCRRVKLLPEDGTGEFADLATSLMDNMKALIMSNQGLLYDYVVALATPDPINRKGIITERRNRPPELSSLPLTPETTLESTEPPRESSSTSQPETRPETISQVTSPPPIDVKDPLAGIFGKKIQSLTVKRNAQTIRDGINTRVIWCCLGGERARNVEQSKYGQYTW